MEVICKFERYNDRRYSLPWVCKMTETGKYDFEQEVGCYTGQPGEPGDLVVFEPVIGQVYGFGQKDYRGGKTLKTFRKWNGESFKLCDKLGRPVMVKISGRIGCDGDFTVVCTGLQVYRVSKLDPKDWSCRTISRTSSDPRDIKPEEYARIESECTEWGAVEIQEE